MAVYDRWHKDPAGDGKPCSCGKDPCQCGRKPCKCGKGRNKLYASAVHGQGKRWQVRWDDPNAPKRRQPRKNFALRDPGPNELPDPDKHASAYDKVIQGSIITRTYRDPNAGNVTLREYAEEWRKSRTHGESAAAGMESRLRNHVYEDPRKPGSGKTPKGGVAIGQHPLALLDQRPSLTAAWVAAMPLADSSKRLVISDVSAVFQAAIEDGAARADPTKSKTVDKPGRGASKAQPYAPAEVAAIAAGMPGRFAIIPYLGAGTGMREMEMAALGADDIVRGKSPKVRVLRQLKHVDGELRFAPLKNKKPHDVPLAPELLSRIDARAKDWPPLPVTLPWHEPGSKLHGTPVAVRLLLSKEDGKPATKSALEVAWRTAVMSWRATRVKTWRLKCKAVRGYGIHRLRHSYASSQLRAGIDVVRVAAWMGDTVHEVTKTYAHLMPDDRDGEAAGRAASAAFLGACALPVPREKGDGASGLAGAV